MTFTILLYNLNLRCEVIEALLYLYPTEKELLYNKFNDLVKNISTIQVKNDVILFDYDNDYGYGLDENMFIDIINILKKCNEKTFILITNKDEYIKLSDFNTKFESEYSNIPIHIYVVNNNDIIEIDPLKLMFFKDIQTIDINMYIRQIKLKQLL